jgi:hypothetical protein
MGTFPKLHYYELVERAIIRLGQRRPTPFSASIDAKRRAQLARFQKKGFLEGVKKSPSPVILSEAKNLHLFVFKKIKADSSLRSE